MQKKNAKKKAKRCCHRGLNQQPLDSEPKVLHLNQLHLNQIVQLQIVQLIWEIVFDTNSLIGSR
jgi:hypothetical protein